MNRRTMKTEEEIRNKIEQIKTWKANNKDEARDSMYGDWLDAMSWTLGEYCSGIDCAWCTNTNCINM